MQCDLVICASSLTSEIHDEIHSEIHVREPFGDLLEARVDGGLQGVVLGVELWKGADVLGVDDREGVDRDLGHARLLGRLALQQRAVLAWVLVEPWFLSWKCMLRVESRKLVLSLLQLGTQLSW